jgi:hypothetical protein
MTDEDEQLQKISKMFIKIINKLQKLKPEDKSSTDRDFAICITDLEKVQAYFEYWIMPTELE